MAHDTIEVYVRELAEEEAVAWLEEVFDGLEKVQGEPIVTYEGQFSGTTVPVQITERVQGGPYTSLWFNAADAPWDSPTACARAAHAALGREVLCYPDPSDDPWRLLRMAGGETERVDERELEEF